MPQTHNYAEFFHPCIRCIQYCNYLRANRQSTVINPRLELINNVVQPRSRTVDSDKQYLQMSSRLNIQHHIIRTH